MTEATNVTGTKAPCISKRAILRLWVCLVPVAMLIFPTIIVIIILQFSTEAMLESGLIQPLVAAIFALLIVSSARATKGSFSNDRRKGALSASGGVIAVRLWAICFVIFLIGILASAVIVKGIKNWTSDIPKEMTVVEINSAGDVPGYQKNVAEGRK